jgi:hypothetical protein
MQELARALNAAVEKRRPGADGGTSTTALPGRRRSPLGLAIAFVLGVALTAGAWSWRQRHHQAPVIAPTSAPIAGGTLIVASEPAGARVELDGVPVAETTPTTIRGVAPGAHVVRVSGDRRTPVEQHTKVADGERALVQMKLPPSSHHVRLETIPSGAFAYVNGVLQVGQTPLDLLIDDDEFYQLSVEKDGFEMTLKSITPDDRDPLVSVTLLPEKSERGTLLLDSDIVAEVWVDGQSSGFYSPTMFRLPAGDHTVQLRDTTEVRSPVARVKIKVGHATQLMLKGTRGP